MDFEQQLNEEVSKRLAVMEDPKYPFPERMKKIDWVIAGIIIAISFVVIEAATLLA